MKNTGTDPDPDRIVAAARRATRLGPVTERLLAQPFGALRQEEQARRRRRLVGLGAIAALCLPTWALAHLAATHLGPRARSLPPAAPAPAPRAAASAPPAPIAAAPTVPALPASSPPPAQRPRAAEAAPPSWRALARSGQYKRAYAVVDRSAFRGIAAGPDDLLLAADVARLSHHPADAVAPLRALVERFPTDARAPLAAFTLGRVLMDNLGRPGDAADAFATCERLAPGGPLVPHALARQVLASAAAGRADRAAALGRRYLREFPHGPQRGSVARAAGIE